VVLLHSTACDRRMWDPQLPILADAGFRVVRSDMRGYGDSPVPDGPYNNAQDVVELLDLLGAEEFALVRWPYRVTGLALLCTALAGHEPSAELRAFGEREDALLEAGDVSEATDLNVDTLLGPHADQATREKVREMQRRAFDVQLAAVEQFPQLRPEFDRADITAATLLISGDHDLPDFRQIALRLSRELADARHLELDWAGHLPSLERPEAVNPLLLDFLRGTHAGSGRDQRS
jgi:3-oxoadipate enol-lactonase